MKATSISPQSGQPAAGGSAVAFLHGHQLERNRARAVTAEAAGTFVLVLAITSAAVAATLSRPVAGTPYGSLAVPVAGGLALAIAVASLGHISGTHLNPAVTLGLAINRQFPWAYAPRGTSSPSSPARYIVANHDQSVNPELERAAARRMGATTYDIDSSYVPMLSHPRLRPRRHPRRCRRRLGNRAEH